MKIITWNCNGAFRKKFEHITDFNADIYIIQECENPAESIDKKYQEWSENYIWIGDNKNKGLGIFATNHIKLKKLNWTNSYKDHIVKHFLPCSINEKFELVGVWTHKNNSPNFGYIGQLWKYLQVNKEKFTNVIIAGDFNSNKIWDQWDRWWNHSDVVKELKEIGIESLYHKFSNEDQGKETKPTFHLQKNKNKPYHIDYCFASKNIYNKFQKIEIGSYENWIKYSDHLPMIFDFAF